MTGTKYACGIAQCGACAVHLDGQLSKSCNISAASAVGRAITTIEGLSPDSSHPVQVAWLKNTVPQCGFCQSGQIMAASALLNGNSNPSDSEIDAAMADNLCRCGTYLAIRAAIHDAAAVLAG
jgi:aerobic-type carbon monoxide dehydrogenase small subunit (CoxS/CutS family)